MAAVLAVLVNGVRNPVRVDMDEDRTEAKLGLFVLAGGAAGFAGTILRPMGPAAAWAAVLACALGTQAAFRSVDIASTSMATRVRLSFVLAFGFVFTWLFFPAREWEWWMPLGGAVTALLLVLPLFPSRGQRGRMARAWPPEHGDAAHLPLPGRGWWWAYYLLLGTAVSLCLKTLPARGWPCACALLLAIAAPLQPLRKLAKRRESGARCPPGQAPSAGPLFPEK